MPSVYEPGQAVYGDEAYNAGVRLVPIRKANMRPNVWPDKLALRAWRKRIEALYSQLEAMGVQRLRGRTTPCLLLRLHASLRAAAITNAH